MATLLRNPGINLREYTPDDDVKWDKAQYRQASEAGKLTMVRVARLDSGHTTSLKSALKTADKQFDIVSEACGIPVVRHVWGLYTPPQAFFDYLDTRDANDDSHPFESLRQVYDEACDEAILPEGMLLVADVDVLHDTFPLSPTQRLSVSAAVAGYKNKIRRNTLYDMAPRQCVNGYRPDENQPSPWIVDIDPMMK